MRPLKCPQRAESRAVKPMSTKRYTYPLGLDPADRAALESYQVAVAVSAGAVPTKGAILRALVREALKTISPTDTASRIAAKATT